MALTMIDPASSWFKIAKLPVVERLCRQTINSKELLIADEIFDKTSERIAKLVNKTWSCRYPWCCHLIYDNGNEFKLHFKYIRESYGIKHKPTMVNNPWANGILERKHQVLGQATQSWIRYGRFSYPWWRWCLSRQCGMGDPLYLSHGTLSLPRCRHFQTRHALWHEKEGNHWPIVAISTRTLNIKYQ